MLKLMRPHQWVKNGFLFMGLIFGHGWSEPSLVQAVLLAFFAFCLASSTVYVLNDLHDVAEDRLHPAQSLSIKRACLAACWRRRPCCWPGRRTRL